ncbi:MAG: EamA family transporter [Candidatus Vogelbacteria bacterium]|nr:EamA family transporter [Candidatus Vogelbacteria bacterium]
MIWLIPLAILIFFELAADIFAKEWSLNSRFYLLAVVALIFYLLANTSWLFALKNGSGLARGAAVFSVTSAILAAMVGFFIYHESLERVQVIGIVIGLTSLFFIFWPEF